VQFGDGAPLYRTFNDKLTAYLDNADGLISSVDTLRPALVACGELPDTVAGQDRADVLKDCADELNKVPTLPNAEFNNYLNSIKVSYADFAKVYAEGIKLTDPYGSQASKLLELNKKVTTDQKAISTATSDFTDALQKRDDELSVKDSAETLYDFLSSKQ
jgi:hypothetical protein